MLTHTPLSRPALAPIRRSLIFALKQSFLLAAGAALMTCGSQAQAEPLLKENDHLAFIGDQVVGDPGYTVQVEDYIIACAQVPNVEIGYFGWCAQTADAFVPQIETCLKPFKPTVATIFFSSNGQDGDARRTSETSLIEALKKAGVRTIILGSPKCVDSILFHQGPTSGEVVNQQLKTIADGDKELAAKEGIVYADVFGATFSAMTTAKQKYGPQFSFDLFGEFRIHHINIAITYAFLKALGFDGDLGSITVDYATNTTSTTGHHKVSTFNDQLLVAQSSTYTFCYPCTQGGSVPQNPLVNCLPFNQDLNRFTLIVKNLPPSSIGAKIIWNSVNYNGQRWKDYTTDELAKGIVLPDVTEAPFTQRFSDITGMVIDQQAAQAAAGLARLAGTTDANAEGRARAAQINARSYVTPIPYKIFIQPLVKADPPGPAPIPIIVDTDMSGDVDDVGALALANSFCVQGEAKLLACVVDMVDHDQSSGAVCKAINTWYGNGDVPIGAYHGTRNRQLSGSSYTLAVRQKFCPDFTTDDKLPDGVEVYRKALAAAPDDSVAIISLGLLTNIEDLEESKPDAISPLNGIDLIKKKVKKIVIMANTLKTDQHILDTWPKPIVWTTFIGSYASIGKALINTPEENPVRFAYGHHGGSLAKSSLMNGRQSWDPTAAWLAVRGPGEMWDLLGYGTYRIDATGNPDWRSCDSTKETLASFKMPVSDVVAILDAELARPPKPQGAKP